VLAVTSSTTHTVGVGLTAASKDATTRTNDAATDFGTLIVEDYASEAKSDTTTSTPMFLYSSSLTKVTRFPESAMFSFCRLTIKTSNNVRVVR